MSAQFYARALGITRERKSLAFQADALMFSGEYEAAERRFQEYMDDGESFEVEWALKLSVLPRIRTLASADRHIRQTREAVHRATGSASGTPQEEQRRRLLEALSADALCGLAWFNLGVLEVESGNREEAAENFLIAALMQPRDIEAWCNSILLALEPNGGIERIAMILSMAYEKRGEELIERLYSMAQSQPAGFPTQSFMDGIRTMLDVIAEEEVDTAKPIDLSRASDETIKCY